MAGNDQLCLQLIHLLCIGVVNMGILLNLNHVYQLFYAGSTAVLWCLPFLFTIPPTRVTRTQCCGTPSHWWLCRSISSPSTSPTVSSRRGRLEEEAAGEDPARKSTENQLGRSFGSILVSSCSPSKKRN